ncbi:MAG TPA: GDSL-type esterase/lipase family protein [Polyangiaceae bacterium]|jgi:lysophospholipase L1-like esterase|nr:GDSL-type esterase/lipase family protein [Polyangiaceae bacterium]
MKSPKSTIPSPDGARAAAAVLVVLSSLSVVTCASATRSPIIASIAPTSKPEPPAPPLFPDEPEPSVTAPVATSAEAAPPATPVVPQGSALARFTAALRDAPQRSGPVRVLWLGDSHTAADFWPDAVRKPLQAAYGSGGPGFVYLGLGVYRHTGVKQQREGKWRIEPRQPSLWMKQDDGVFGLGGIRAVPNDATSTLRLELSADSVRGKARWDVAVRLPTNRARVVIAVEGGESHSVDATTVAVGTIAHVTFQTERGAAVTIGHAANDPELFGAIVESTDPGGVVVDNLGINGARIATPLAWERSSWIEQARQRDPSLLVFAYGTNEVGDEVAPMKYGPVLEELVGVAREAAPNADCLVAGPTDREGPGWTPLPRVFEIDGVMRQTAEHLGCAYFSVVDAMGGEGSLKRWAAMTPPLAGIDRVHLTPRGYGELGGTMAKLFIDAPR